MNKIILQDHYAPNSICFGCGPANKKGLQIKSYISEDKEILCEWAPKDHHEAFPGILNGGVIGTLLDCHCNWTAAWHLMTVKDLAHVPCTVTANYSIQLRKPTPSYKPVKLRAWSVEVDRDRVQVKAELMSDNKVCATGEGLFVAVKEGHPAFHRWS